MKKFLKNNKIKYGIVGVLALAVLPACNDYLDINNDPSIPQTASAKVILPPVFAQMVNGESFDTRFFGMYTQMFASNNLSSPAYGTWERHGYQSGSDNGGEKWRSHYWSIGINLDLIIAEGNANNSPDLSGAAKAIRAWSWQSSTDVYGEMILKQAWEPNRYTFDFDGQDAVYAEVVRLSNEALADLDKPNNGRLKPGDLVYSGDVSKWKKFIYGNLARNANHLSNKATYNPDLVISYCDKAMASNADNFNVPHANTSTTDANFFGPKRNNLSQFRVGTMMLKLVDGTTFGGVVDPRLPIMMPASPDTLYRGLSPTATDANINDAKKKIPNIWGMSAGSTVTLISPFATNTAAGRWIFADGVPHYLMTYAEILFIKAEAQFKKGDKVPALATYKAAIGAHMDFCGVAAAAKTTYLASVAVKQDPNLLSLADIMQQKYIALWGHGVLETWGDMRRYRYDPAVYTTFVPLTASQYFPDNSGKYAYRVRPRYNSEYVWNLKSLETFGGTKPEYHTYEMWNIKP